MSKLTVVDEAGNDAAPDRSTYAVLTREQEAAARADAAIVKAHMRTAAESIIEVGLALKRQKERLPHGMFLPWIEAEFDMSQRTAYNMMNVADRKGAGSIMIDGNPTARPEATVIIEGARPGIDGEYRIEGSSTASPALDTRPP